MRVIAGRYKGRKLTSPQGTELRPTPDMVKEAIFGIIGSGIESSVCLDLFAGSGALGIEALSRGAARCYFADASRRSISLLRSNLETIGIEAVFHRDASDAAAEAVIIARDYRAALRSLGAQVDYAFIDPPFDSGCYATVMKLLADYDIIKPGGVVIVECDKNIPEYAHEGFAGVAVKNYGRIALNFWERTGI